MVEPAPIVISAPSLTGEHRVRMHGETLGLGHSVDDVVGGPASPRGRRRARHNGSRAKANSPITDFSYCLKRGKNSES